MIKFIKNLIEMLFEVRRMKTAARQKYKTGA